MKPTYTIVSGYDSSLYRPTPAQMERMRRPFMPSDCPFEKAMLAKKEAEKAEKAEAEAEKAEAEAEKAEAEAKK